MSAVRRRHPTLTSIGKTSSHPSLPQSVPRVPDPAVLQFQLAVSHQRLLYERLAVYQKESKNSDHEHASFHLGPRKGLEGCHPLVIPALGLHPRPARPYARQLNVQDLVLFAKCHRGPLMGAPAMRLQYISCIHNLQSRLRFSGSVPPRHVGAVPEGIAFRRTWRKLLRSPMETRCDVTPPDLHP